MTNQEDLGFYAIYPEFRRYDPPILKRKHVRQFDEEFWNRAACRPDMSFLEIGSGCGQFLAYLQQKGVHDFQGIDLDAAVLDVMPDSLKPHLAIADVWEYLDTLDAARRFDRIAMFDVLEHFSPEEGVRLLRRLKNVMKPDGALIVRVPNAGSPWGLQYQFHDLTHRIAFTDGSLTQLALAAGFQGAGCFPQKRRKGVRRLLEDGLHGILSHVLTESPRIWSANFLALLKPKP